MVEWDTAAHQVAAHRSSFGELVCLFIAPMSCVSFYPIKLNCVFVCKIGESFMAVIDGFVCCLMERACSADRLSPQKVICWLLKVISSSAACLMAAVSAWKTVQYSFILKECSVMVSVRVSYITNPPPVPCSLFSFGSVCKAANAMGTCFYDVRVECVL